MNSVETLKNVKQTLLKKLNIPINSYFNSNEISFPIENNFILLEIESASNNKISIQIELNVPLKNGSDFCRELTQKIASVLKEAEIPNLKEVVQFKLAFDSNKNAFVQKISAKFESDEENKKIKEKTIALTYDNLTFNALEQTTKLKISREISSFFTPFSGMQCTDLGLALKTIEGTANLTEQQFNFLEKHIKFNSKKNIVFLNQTFLARIISLCKNASGLTTFNFIEATDEN